MWPEKDHEAMMVHCALRNGKLMYFQEVVLLYAGFILQVHSCFQAQIPTGYSVKICRIIELFSLLAAHSKIYLQQLRFLGL